MTMVVASGRHTGQLSSKTSSSSRSRRRNCNADQRYSHLHPYSERSSTSSSGHQHRSESNRRSQRRQRSAATVQGPAPALTTSTATMGGAPSSKTCHVCLPFSMVTVSIVCLQGVISRKDRDHGSNGHGRDRRPEHRMPPRLEMLLDMPPAQKEIQLRHAWNSEDR